ncbi:hypothetical protein ACP70R_047420 [Stipagrostis hirtigluma subsp. patula]
MGGAAASARGRRTRRRGARLLRAVGTAVCGRTRRRATRLGGPAAAVEAGVQVAVPNGLRRQGRDARRGGQGDDVGQGGGRRRCGGRGQGQQLLGVQREELDGGGGGSEAAREVLPGLLLRRPRHHGLPRQQGCISVSMAARRLAARRQLDGHGRAAHGWAAARRLAAGRTRRPWRAATPRFAAGPRGGSWAGGSGVEAHGRRTAATGCHRPAATAIFFFCSGDAFHR